MASNCFSNRVTSRPSVTFTAPNKETDFRVGARSTTGSFSSGGTHIATLVPWCWKWHSSKLHKSVSFLFAKLRRFFKSLLFGWISMSNQWPRLSQAKSKLMKEPLALPYTQRHLMQFFNMMRQKFPVPHILRIAKIPWRFTQRIINRLQMLRRQTIRPSCFLAIFQTGKAALLKTPNPSLNRCRILTEHFCDFVGRKTPTNKQHAMQPMVITGILRSKNLVLKSYFHNIRIRYIKSFHAALLVYSIQKGRLISNLFMLHYLCRGV